MRSAPASPPPAAAPKPAAASSRFILNVVAGSSKGQRFRLLAAGCGVGRERGAIQFKEDATVAAQHAAFVVRDGALFVRAAGPHAAVYVSLRGEEPLSPGDRFAAGGRLLRYRGPLSPPPLVLGRPQVYGAPMPPNVSLYGLEEALLGDRPGRGITHPGPTVTVGQSGCDFNFPSELGIAGRHCEVSIQKGQAVLRDVSGGLGTFVRLGTQERELMPSDRVRIGDQIVMVEQSA